MCLTERAKGLRKFRLSLSVAAVFLMLFAIPDVVMGRQLSRYHSIDIEVECIETAREIINGLNGYNLESSASFNESQQWANFTRRVDEWAFRHVQEVLRSLGEILSESENAYFLGPEIMNIETRLSVVSQEMERLTLMMSASDSLSVLIAINDRISTVSRDRDWLIGRRNVLLMQAENPIIYIHLVETPKETPKDSDSFGSRIAQSFLDSWNATLRIGGDALVGLAKISLPAAIWIIVGGVAGLVIFKRVKKREPVVEEVE